MLAFTGKQFEIIRSIVCFVPVLMVDGFRVSQFPSKLPLHDKAMLKNVTVTGFWMPVSFDVHIPIFSNVLGSKYFKALLDTTTGAKPFLPIPLERSAAKFTLSVFRSVEFTVAL